MAVYEHFGPDSGRGSPPRPFPGSYWVLPGCFLAGPLPWDRDEAASRARLGALLETGIRSYISLMEIDESDGRGPMRAYEVPLARLADELGVDVRSSRFPIPDMGVPTPERMSRILDGIDEYLRRGEAIYLHCWGGVGRTGTVVGCYIVRHGLSGDVSPVDFLNGLRRADPGTPREAPETEVQRRMVESWKRGE